MRRLRMPLSVSRSPARALCWRCACLRCRACVPHARVACTCCACACCACLRYARLRFPCSRCVHLLCLPLLCVPVLCAFVRCVVCLCSAHLHRVELAEPASPSTLATCHDLYPFPILSHICLLLSCISSLFAPFLACVVPSFYSIFYCTLCSVPACGCASERWHRSRCPQLNFPATYLCLLCLPAALFSFLPQKRKQGAV